MPDALASITNLINSPPGQLVAGGVLAGIVWKFFDKVEEKLSDMTKFEIAVWLVGVKPLGSKMEPWPDTFAKVFDRVFTSRHLSWTCYVRSYCWSMLLCLLCSTWATLTFGRSNAPILSIFYLCMFSTLLLWNFDYLALLKTRYVISLMKANPSVMVLALLLLGDAVAGGFIGLPPASYAAHRIAVDGATLPAQDRPPLRTVLEVFWVPLFGTSIWLWLYAGSGFLLKAARRFDIGFQWFNRHFDIEHKPLSSIGLVAGALVALVYWAAVIAGRVM